MSTILSFLYFRIILGQSYAMSRKKVLRDTLLVYLLIICFFSLELSAQSKEIYELDSLKVQLSLEEDSDRKTENYPKQDSKRLNLLLEICREIGSSDSRALIQYSKEALAISKSANDQSRIGESYKLIGLGFQYNSEADSALFYFEKSVETYVELKDEVNYGTVLNKIGAVLTSKADYSDAMESLNIALEIGERLQNQRLLMESNSNLGEVYRARRFNQEALVFYAKALNLAQKAADTFSLASIHRNIGAVYYELANDNESYINYSKALNLHRSGAIKDVRTHMYLLISMGNTTIYLAKYKEAIALFEEAESMAKEINSPRALTYAYIGFSFCYKTMADESGKNSLYAQSIIYSYQALDLAQEAGLANEEYQVLIGMTGTYESMGDFENAFKTSKKEIALKDSLFNETKSAQFAEMKTKYETEQKDKENLILESQVKEQQLWVLSLSVGGVLLFVLLFISYRFFLERKKVAQKLFEDKEIISKQAKELQALDSFKSRFFANVSHDLRTPLTLIQGYLSSLKTGDSYLDTKGEESIKKLEANTSKLVMLTDEIKDLILLEDDKLQLNFSKIEIVTHMQRLVHLFSSAAEMNHINLNFTSETDDSLMIHLDSFQFEKIMYNLLANALKFSAKGGQIEVKLSNQENEILIAIKDDGAGIAPDKVAYIFSRYFQASDEIHYNKEGMGIGLALVMELVKLHGGTIKVESELEKGSTFFITLPHNLDKEITSEESGLKFIKHNKALLEELTNTESLVDLSENGKRASNAPTVLIVDDHPDIRAYIQGIIEDDYIIRQAANGKEALIVLKREKIDIVITDLMMPWMGGHELIEKMKNQEVFKEIPILVISARTTEEDKLKVLEEGVNNFLAKPFQPNELKLRISNALINLDARTNIWDALANDKKKLNDVQKNVLAKVNTLILSRIDDSSLSVQNIADELATSSRNAYNIIKEITEVNPKDYIKLIKFQYAEDLMKKKKVKSLTEAARAIGMSNATDFSKQYQKKMGVHPAELMGK